MGGRTSISGNGKDGILGRRGSTGISVGISDTKDRYLGCEGPVCWIRKSAEDLVGLTVKKKGKKGGGGGLQRIWRTEWGGICGRIAEGTAFVRAWQTDWGGLHRVWWEEGAGSAEDLVGRGRGVYRGSGRHSERVCGSLAGRAGGFAGVGWAE
uniref:Uncharacterized protein n=1 Tax=Chromera velia CCMP2878 TaxID=1169474 RepID=A0A0G4F4C4_9ALVE|eukprot:Cvel_2707.t1-p1 / transcript=Cvel_2707.t1 / gene=Cvel_2707 / organism=Chromera_velia_CCMP2878 / gene_product=hypothetical protein / transcript_product=hypothetical protein / location=Cvel_scaffold108:104564-105019(-) / protein_length=152 / sequence_SO=supercontig / SO=protein_coding / is_pseudo=false